CAADSLADRFGVGDILVDHGIGRERLDGVVLHPITITRPRQLQELDRCRADVDRYFGRLAFCDQPHNFPLYSRALTRTTCPGALDSGLCAALQLPATGGATAVSSPDPRCRPRPHQHPLYTGTAPQRHAPGRPLPLGNPPDAPVPPPAALGPDRLRGRL